MNLEGSPSIPDARPEKPRSNPGPLERLWKWIDQRTGAEQILRRSLDEPIPGGARFAYVFGSALLFIFLSQIVTGLCLALYYVPSPLTAHASVAYIVKEVAAGAFLRSLHSYGSSAMVVVLALHFLQTCFYGSYKGKRELLWISGCTLSLLVLAMAFTGYLLSWSQSGYSAASVGTDIMGQVPLIGEKLRLLLRGGSSMGALTLSRFYILHVFVIPGLIFCFIAVHIFLFRKAGAAGPVTEDPVNPGLPTETFYPRQVLIDMTFVLVVMGVLGMLAHFVPVTLGLHADPSNTRYIPRPEWYFLPMFQWLKSWEGWSTVIGVFIIPVILIGLIFALPFMDRGLERRPWRRPIPVGGVIIVLLGLVWLGMTSRLDDSRDPIVAAQLAEQNQQEDQYFYAAFEPYSEASSSKSAASGSLNAAAAEGKGLFDSHGCSGCHGASGGGAVGPALTHISAQYPPAQLTTLLKAPTAKMKAGGMVPLTLDAADMKALVSYVSGLGGSPAAPAATPAAPAVTPAASGPSSPTSAKAKPAATSAPKGAAAAPSASQSASPAPSEVKSSAEPSKAPVGSSGNDARSATRGKEIFGSQRCSGCHGVNGRGGVGPALTHISAQYPPAQLTTLLKAPTAKMKAGGMVPLTLDAADMKALVSYVSGLGGSPAAPAATPAAPAVTPAASGPSSPTSAKAKPAATSAPKGAAAAPSASQSASPAPSEVKSSAEPSKAPVGSSGNDARSATRGKEIFGSQRCSGCHGVNGRGGVGPALTHISAQYPPAQLTTLLKAPTAKMKAGGMVPLTLDAADMKALVSYVSGLGGTPAGPAAAATPVSSAPTKEELASTAPQSKEESAGQAIFKTYQCAFCHGPDGVGGTAAGPALAGTGQALDQAQLAAMLTHPTAAMRKGRMPPVTLSAGQLKALIAYLSFISAAKSNLQ